MKTNHLTRIVLFLAAFVGMGMSLPSCPGDKAMQQQIDMLQQSNTDMSRKLMTLDSEIKSTDGDITAEKSLINQLAATVTAQKDAIDNLYNQIKQLQTKIAAQPAAKKSSTKSKSKKKHSSG